MFVNEFRVRWKYGGWESGRRKWEMRNEKSEIVNSK